MSERTSDDLLRSTPESRYDADTGISNFIDAVEDQKLGLHSIILMCNGEVRVEGYWAPYAAGERHMLFSLSKSFTSTAAGLAIAEGFFTLDDPVVSFFPDDLPADIGPNLAAMRVRDLLTMSTGHDADTTWSMHQSNGRDWEKLFLAHSVLHEPGTHFVYNSGATYMVSSIVQRTTGQKVADYLKPRLFDPLGMAKPLWDENAGGVNVGGWGLNLTTEEIARFGQLYLQEGIWRGKRLLPEGWAAEATRSHIANGAAPDSDWAQGYGFQFWRSRHGSYRGDGAFGQFCFVLPSQNSVLAITSGTNDMQAVMNAVWEHLLPSISQDEAPPFSRSQSPLSQKAAGLELPGPAGQVTSALSANLSGATWEIDRGHGEDVAESMAWAGEGQITRPETVTWEFDGLSCAFTLRNSQGTHRVVAGLNSWRVGTTTLWQSGPVGARGAWTDESAFAIEICYTGGPYSKTITAAFSGDTVTLKIAQNVSFRTTEFPMLEGRRR